jgi:acyl-CoA dehydrogenase
MKKIKASQAASSFLERFSRFGKKCIAEFPALHELAIFPDDLWEQMIKKKLFGVTIDNEFGGQGQTIYSLTKASITLVEYGGNMGVAMSWLIHEMVARWIVFSFGTERQKAIYLPQLATGKKTLCFAVSEPKVGAHPKHIKTSAKKISAGFCLNGEKTYLTNGPIADLFIVIAITGQASGKNRFTAFIVPKDTPGLNITDPINFPFLHPSPHGGILLKDCMVKPEQVLGNSGAAYTKMVLPFRTIEDTMMMGPITGGLKFLFRHLICQLKQQDILPDELLITETAQLKCALNALDAICEITAKELDKNIENENLLSLGLFFKAQTTGFLEKVGQIFEKKGIEPDQKITYMINDLSALTRIAENASKIKLAKIGNSLFC